MTTQHTRHNRVLRNHVDCRELVNEQGTGFVIRLLDSSQIITLSQQPGHDTIAIESIPARGFGYPLSTDAVNLTYTPGKAEPEAIEAVAVQLSEMAEYSNMARFALQHLGVESDSL